MPEYGLTPTGPNIKRLEDIRDEMHKDLTEKWGVNTRQNEESFLNHLITNIADQLAQAWEFGEEVYFAMYPSSAEGVSLDNAAQFGGSTRELPEKSYYPILCTGIDGTIIPSRTIIASDTNPAINLVLMEERRITREAFNKAEVILAADHMTGSMGIALNGTLYTKDVQPELGVKANLEALAAEIKDEDFNISVTDDAIVIESKDETLSHVMVLSENLTTRTVGSVITFATEEYGDIKIPNGIVTNIVRAVVGLESVVNVGNYVAGRLKETDVEFRQSYADKIFNRSSTMIESIRSAILKNVQGVVSCAVYENASNIVDEAGRYPHSVEVVVDGGDRTEIAQQILDTKAGGISTFGSQEVELHGVYGETITIRFNRPTEIKVWFHVGVTLSRSTNPPSNYVDMIKEQIIDGVTKLGAGADVIPQNFLPRVSGIDYMDITLHVNDGEDVKPDEYELRSVLIADRERAVTDENRIEVVIDG